MTDLGLIVDSMLTWNEHIIDINNKASQRLGLLKRTLGYKINQSIKLHCYKFLVQPLLEYCTPIWSNFSRKNVEKLEAVQRRGTSYILNDFKHEIDHRARLSQCEILPLSYRTYLVLSFLVNILHESNYLDFEANFRFLPATRSLITNNNIFNFSHYENNFLTKQLMFETDFLMLTEYS